MSACTCQVDAAEHPGPNINTGRGAPEIDILEAEKDKTGREGGSVSQSAQFAPFSENYNFDQTQTTIYNTTITNLNTYKCVLVFFFFLPPLIWC